MLSESFKNFIEETLTAIKDDIIQEMDEKDFNASGRTKDSLEVHAEDFYGELVGLRSFQTIVAKRLSDGGSGRGPTEKGGDGELYRSILQWIEDKGIVPDYGTKEGLAYVITRMIHRRGTQLYRGVRDKGGVDLIGIAQRRIQELVDKIPQIIYTNLKRDAPFSNSTT